MILVFIEFEINGRRYTTKEDFDHSSICELIEFEDLVPIYDGNI